MISENGIELCTLTSKKHNTPTRPPLNCISALHISLYTVDNVSSSTDLAESINQLYSILNDPLKSNLKEAYDSYLKYDEFDDELSDILDECDTIFYKNEEDLNDLLWEYAKSIEI